MGAVHREDVDPVAKTITPREAKIGKTSWLEAANNVETVAEEAAVEEAADVAKADVAKADAVKADAADVVRAKAVAKTGAKKDANAAKSPHSNTSWCSPTSRSPRRSPATPVRSAGARSLTFRC